MFKTKCTINRFVLFRAHLMNVNVSLEIDCVKPNLLDLVGGWVGLRLGGGRSYLVWWKSVLYF